MLGNEAAVIRTFGEEGVNVGVGVMKLQAETEKVYWGQTEILPEPAAYGAVALRKWGASPWWFWSRGGSVSSSLQAAPLGTGLCPCVLPNSTA